MTLLMALLCLGLSVGAGTPVQAEPDFKRALWAEPSNTVANGSAVTIWCEGVPGAEAYRLEKTGSTGNTGSRTIQMSRESGDKAKYHIEHAGPDHGGLYSCGYCIINMCADSGTLLALAVTGLYSKPSLSALPSPVVASGATVTLQCSSSEGFLGFVFTQDDKPHPSYLKSQPHPSGQVQALFSVGPVTPGHQWTFQCFGHFHDSLLRSQPSDPLQLLVSDASGRPALLSPQGPIATPGQTLTLQCCSQVSYNQFALAMEGARDLHQRPGHQTQPGLSQADFLLGPVNSSHGGRYRCYGGHGHSPVWSEPSDPLDILVAGADDYTPTLSAQPGPTVSPGDNVTLRCFSTNWQNIFLLAKEGTVDLPLSVPADNSDRFTQAEFSFHPVTTAHGGTYRCYSSRRVTPYQLSHPSAPLQLRVSDPSQSDAHPHDYTAENLGRMLLGAVVLLLLGILLLEAHLTQGRPRRPSGADSGAHELVELQPEDSDGHRG